MERVYSFFDQGGPLLLAIFMVSMLMWFLILERYWFFHYQLSHLTSELKSRWQKRKPHLEVFSEQRLKHNLLNEYVAQLFRGMRLVEILTQTLPLLGLLGTVSGMIKVFEVINVFGAGNARGMASGISEALITTMAGLITALSGLFFSANLESRIKRASERFSAHLSDG